MRNHVILIFALFMFYAATAQNLSAQSSEAAFWGKLSTAAIPVKHCNGPPFSLPDAERAKLPPRIVDPRFHDDDYRANIAEKYPGGFAGNMYDLKTHQPLIMLTHPEKIDELKKAIAADPVFRHFDIMGAAPRKVRWDFAQLVDWYKYLEPYATRVGMTSGDKDEAANRVDFGIATKSGATKLAKTLRALRIPCDLVQLHLEWYPQIDSGQVIPPAPRAKKHQVTSLRFGARSFSRPVK